MKLNSRFLRYFGHPQKFFSDEKILNFLGVKSGINHFEYKVVIQWESWSFSNSLSNQERGTVKKIKAVKYMTYGQIWLFKDS